MVASNLLHSKGRNWKQLGGLFSIFAEADETMIRKKVEMNSSLRWKRKKWWVRRARGISAVEENQKIAFLNSVQTVAYSKINPQERAVKFERSSAVEFTLPYFVRRSWVVNKFAIVSHSLSLFLLKRKAQTTNLFRTSRTITHTILYSFH